MGHQVPRKAWKLQIVLSVVLMAVSLVVVLLAIQARTSGATRASASTSDRSGSRPGWRVRRSTALSVVAGRVGGGPPLLWELSEVELDAEATTRAAGDAH